MEKVEDYGSKLKELAEKAKVRKDPAHGGNWLFDLVEELHMSVGIPAKTEAEARDLLEAFLEREKKEGRIKG